MVKESGSERLYTFSASEKIGDIELQCTFDAQQHMYILTIADDMQNRLKKLQIPTTINGAPQRIYAEAVRLAQSGATGADIYAALGQQLFGSH